MAHVLPHPDRRSPSAHAKAARSTPHIRFPVLPDSLNRDAWWLPRIPAHRDRSPGRPAASRRRTRLPHFVGMLVLLAGLNANAAIGSAPRDQAVEARPSSASASVRLEDPSGAGPEVQAFLKSLIAPARPDAIVLPIALALVLARLLPFARKNRRF